MGEPIGEGEACDSLLRREGDSTGEACDSLQGGSDGWDGSQRGSEGGTSL
jgi:hypothetical protein